MLSADQYHTSEIRSSYSTALLDRLTKSALGVLTAETDLKPLKLKEYFESALYELCLVKEKLTQQTNQLERKCRLDERLFRTTIDRLRLDLEGLNQQFSKLDTDVHMVSGKLVHLGDQLERKNLPRKRIEEARDLILEFYKFLGAGGATVSSSVNAQADENQILEAAHRFKNLSSLCLELPDDDRFLTAKQRVTVASQHLEGVLLERFRVNYTRGNKDMMKNIADILINSKGYSQCSEILIDETLRSIDSAKIDLKAISKRLVSTEKLIMSIFLRPDFVVMQLINNLFASKLKVHITNRIKSDMPPHLFLDNLYREYRNMDMFVKELSNELTLVTDPMQLGKLFRDMFSDYLCGYMQRECEWLTARLTAHLAQYYDSKGHEKRALNTSGLADLRRDIQAKLHISPGEKDQSAYDDSFISEEVAVNIIEDIRRASRRCLLLSQPQAIPENGKYLYYYLHQFLMCEHVDYAVTLALHGLQVADFRSNDPNFVFFSVVHDATLIFHFFERTLDESIMPLVGSNPDYVRELSVKRQTLKQELEVKFSTGLDRCLNLTISRVQHILSNEQRKKDFRPDSSVHISMVAGSPSSLACQHVVTFLTQISNEVHRYLDGQNRKSFSHELGMKLNRTLLDHFYNHTFSDTGGFIAMQDVTAYREVAKQFESSTVDLVFDVLLKMMNLMIIIPENVEQVIQDYLQSGIPKDLLISFLQLRSDHKTLMHLKPIK